MPAEFSNPAGVYQPAAYSQLCRVGNTLYVAGQTAQDEQGDIVGVGDIAAQAEQAFRNVGTILESQGAGFSDITSMRIYVTDVDHRSAISGARERCFTPPLPPSTFLVVKGLAFPDLLVEVEVTATLD